MTDVFQSLCLGSEDGHFSQNNNSVMPKIKQKISCEALKEKKKGSVHAKEAHKQTRMSSRTTAMVALTASEQMLIFLRLMRSLKDY